MDIQKIKKILIAKFGEDVIQSEDQSGLQPALIIHPDKIADVCLELRDNQHTYFDFLACLTGVHYHTQNQFSVVYNLASIPYQTRLTLKVIKYHEPGSEMLPSFKSVCTVWRTADWHEREAYDLVGIWFDGHPDLRRILLPDDWEGFPLRKDYQAAEYYNGIKID